MTCDELLKRHKTKAAIARAAGVERQIVQDWFTRNRVPLNHQITLEVESGGELKADVMDEFRKLLQD